MSYLMSLYNRLPVSIVRGSGVYMYDEAGTAYIDGCAGVAVNNLGHLHPHLCAALHDQIDTLWHTGNLVIIPQQEVLAERLCKLSGFGLKAFFCNSGAEAWEATIKIARKYHKDRGHHEKYRGIVMRGCYHGRSIAGVSAAMRDYMINGFAPLDHSFDLVPPNDIAALEAAITPHTAYINVEPIMGEGGVTTLDIPYLRAIRALCDKHDVLMLVDEVQCGMGRTGKMFAYEWADIEPDLMAIAKGLGCGFPMGAYVAGEKCAQTMTPGSHGATFGGNPMACAVGNAVIDVMTGDGFLDHVTAMGTRLGAGLLAIAQDFPALLDMNIRGRGLLRGLLCVQEGSAQALARACLDEKLIMIPAMQNVLRVMPPLIITTSEVDDMLARLRGACGRL